MNRNRRSVVNSKYASTENNNFDISNIKLGRKRNNPATLRASKISNVKNTQQNTSNSLSNVELNEDNISNNNSKIGVNASSFKAKKQLNSDSNYFKQVEKLTSIPNKQPIMISNTTDQTLINFMNERPSSIMQTYLYKPTYSLPDLTDFVSDLIEVKISNEFLSTKNKAFKDRSIYGSDIYTSNSDCVLILQHSGYLTLESSPPENFKGIALYLRVMKSRSSYNSTTKYGIKSNRVSSYQGHSIKPEGFSILSTLGTDDELLEIASKMTLKNRLSISETRNKCNSTVINQNSILYTKNEALLTINLSFEPSFKYSISALVDKSYDNPKDFLSYKLKNQVLYIESNNKRFEISRVNKSPSGKESKPIAYGNDSEGLKELEVASLAECGGDTDEELLFEKYERFRLAEVLNPFNKDNCYMIKSKAVPLEDNNIKILNTNLDWADFLWGINFLKVKNLMIDNLTCFKFYDIK